MVMEVVIEDMEDGNMQCLNHPYKKSTAGGICAFCLQEKLGKLVSSSLSVAIFPSSLSSSPSVRSDIGGTTTTTTKKKKKKEGSIIFKRSKSTATNPRMHFRDTEEDYNNSPNYKRGSFWSFFYSKTPTSKKNETTNIKGVDFSSASLIVVEGTDDCTRTDRKVYRSRSVGCGSRKFSGDLLERISSGLGDCTVVRRVESQRGNAITSDLCIKERVKCGGIFGGFAITGDHHQESTSSSVNGRTSSVGSKSWGWALASPLRAFSSSKPSTSTGNTEGETHNKNNIATPNLAVNHRNNST